MRISGSGARGIAEVNNVVDQILQVYKCISRKAFQVSGTDGKGLKQSPDVVDMRVELTCGRMLSLLL